MNLQKASNGWTSGVALITGAGSGIGRDVAHAFASQGARAVVFADYDLAAAQEAAQESTRIATNKEYKNIALHVDVGDEELVQIMVNATVGAFGRIDYFVNSAGIGVEKPSEITNTSLSEFDQFYRVNVKGSMLCTRAVSAAMKEQEPLPAIQGRTGPRDMGRGAIVLLGSCNSYVATPHIVQYTAAKHAVLGIARNAALDNAPYGIRVNAICPSWVETPMIERAVAGDPNLGKIMTRVVPMSRLAQPEEVSDVILFLCSPRASYVTGAGWLVDGGATLQMQT